MSLDENVIGEVLQMLSASQEMNPETQSEVFTDIQSFKSLDQINLYLLEAIGNDQLPDVSRCVAAILMRHYFIACENKDIKETFKNNAFQVLSPFFNLPPSPLTNCVSALFAELLKYFGSSVFGDIVEIITQLLSDSDLSESGLSLVMEVLERDIDLDNSVLELLQPHLQTEHSAYVLKICALLARKYPEEVKSQILSVVFSANLSELNQFELMEAVNISQICLELSDYEETIVEFLVFCINSQYDDVSTNAALTFEENENIPFSEEVLNALYQRLSTNQELYVYNNSYQCLKSIEKIVHLYPEESMQIISGFIEQCQPTSDKKQIINMLRCITVVADLLESPDDIAQKANTMFNVEPKETVYCLSMMSPNCPSVAGPALEAISPLLVSDIVPLRIQVMRCLPIIMKYTVVPCEPLTTLFLQCNEKYSLWENVLLCRTVGVFFAEVEDFESSESAGPLIEKICTMFNEFQELDPLLYAFFNILPNMPRCCPNMMNYIMSTCGERLFAFLGSDDTELATGAMDFYTGLVTAGLSGAAQELLTNIIGILPRDNFLGSSIESRKVSGWKFMHSLLLHDQGLFGNVVEWIQPGACAEMEGQFMGMACDEICSTLFDLIGNIEYTQKQILEIFQLLKYIASKNFITNNVTACFLKLMGLFPEVCVLDDSLMQQLMQHFSLLEGTERQEECEQYMQAYLEVHPQEE